MMRILNDLWEFFFPRYCVVCGRRLLTGEEHLCLSCLSALPRTGYHRFPGHPMEKALWGKIATERVTAFLFYAKGGPVRQILYALKYYGNQRIGVFMGRCMAAELKPSGFFDGIDCLMPVPLHAAKLKHRGYNQSASLAEGISAVTGIPVGEGLLVKVRSTDTQTRKSSYERWVNMRDVFVCPSERLLEGKHVLLVDDVFTTGATMVACADAMQGVRGLRISVLTLALAGES